MIDSLASIENGEPRSERGHDRGLHFSAMLLYKKESENSIDILKILLFLPGIFSQCQPLDFNMMCNGASRDENMDTVLAGAKLSLAVPIFFGALGRLIRKCAGA